MTSAAARDSPAPGGGRLADLGRSDVDTFLSNLYIGITLASIFLLVGLGLTFTFGQMGVINMAHGEFIMAGAYVPYVLQTTLFEGAKGTAVLVALPVAFLVAGLMGVVLERLLLRRMYGRPLDTLLVTFGVSLILQQAAKDLFSANNKDVATPDVPAGPDRAARRHHDPHPAVRPRSWCCVSMGLVWLFLSQLAAGRRMRAVTQNRDLAAVSGLPASRVDAITFFLGSGLAGVAGVAVSLIGSIGTGTGTAYIVDRLPRGDRGRPRQAQGRRHRRPRPRHAELLRRVLDVVHPGQGGRVRLRHPVPAVPAQRHRLVPHPGARRHDRYRPRTAPAPSTPAVRRRRRRRRPGEAHRRTPAVAAGAGVDQPVDGPLAFVAFAVVLFAVPSFMGNPTDVRQWAEWLCYAMVAVGLDLAWGYGGMLGPGPGPVLRARRLRHGHAPVAGERARRLAALVHEPVQRLHGAARAVAAVPELLVRGLRRRPRAHARWPACSACWCSSAASGARSSPSSPRPRR